jgi:glycerol transport system ATP-binding protein
VARFAGMAVPTANRATGVASGARTQIGVRPEFVRFADRGVPVRVVQVTDAGRHQIVETRHGDTVIRVLLGEHEPVPAHTAHLAFDPAFTRLYADGWLAGEGG